MGHRGQGLLISAKVDLALSQDLQVRKDVVGTEEAMIVCLLLLFSKDFFQTQKSHAWILRGVEGTWKALEEEKRGMERT